MPAKAPLEVDPNIEATVIEPRHGLRRLHLRDVWRHRELLYLLVWRELKSRYKQTMIGAVWVVLQPLLLMSLFALIFGRLVRIDVGDLPRPVFYFAALVPWTYFTAALNGTTSSLVRNQALVTKVYFPRLLLPLAAVIPNLVDMAISFTLLIGMVFVFDLRPGIGMLAVPALALLAVMTALAAGLWLGTLNARYRDVQHGIGFFIQVWFFASPILYPASLVPEAFRPIYNLNPMAGVIQGFRWAATGHGGIPDSIYLSAAIVAVVLVSGLWIFRRHEDTIVDVV